MAEASSGPGQPSAPARFALEMKQQQALAAVHSAQAEQAAKAVHVAHAANAAVNAAANAAAMASACGSADAVAHPAALSKRAFEYKHEVYPPLCDERARVDVGPREASIQPTPTSSMLRSTFSVPNLSMEKEGVAARSLGRISSFNEPELRRPDNFAGVKDEVCRGSVLSSGNAAWLKVAARRLTARAATAWLLSGGYRGKIPSESDPRSPRVPTWCINTSAACLRGVSKEMAKHTCAKDAENILKTRLGSHSVELDWLSFPASACGLKSNNAENGSGEEFIARARVNYRAWDPEPNEKEWAVESMIMREIGRRYTGAFVSVTPEPGDTVLGLSIRIANAAAEATGSPIVSLKADPN